MKKLVFVIVALFLGSALIAKRPAATIQEGPSYGFRVGDDVCLTTCSQIMTIEEILPDGKMLCNYLSRKDHTYKVEAFDEGELKKIKVIMPYEKRLISVGNKPALPGRS